MYIIPEKNSNGAYPAPLITKAKGLLYLPDNLRDAFFKYNGFVNLTIEGDTITAVKADTKAWEEWKASIPEPEETDTDNDVVTWAELDAAYNEGRDTAYDE